jgi:hypothetical protein
MFILVDAKTNRIVGTAAKPVSVESCSRNGQKVFEISDHEFSIDMIGSVLKLPEEK